MENAAIVNFVYCSNWGTKYKWAENEVNQLRILCEQYALELQNDIKVFQEEGANSFSTTYPSKRPDYDWNQINQHVSLASTHFHSCLNHVICFLRELDEGTSMLDASQNEFPIFLSNPLNSKNINSWNRKLEGLSQWRKDKILEFQPFHSPHPQKHSLAILKHMRDMDQHRGLIQTFPPSNKMSLKFDIQEFRRSFPNIKQWGSSHEELPRPVGTPDGTLGAGYSLYWAPQVEIGDQSRVDVLVTFDRIAKFIKDNIFLHSFFGDGWDHLPDHIKMRMFPAKKGIGANT